ncbi:MAG TPA: tol-pal system-associated acyl-CoA thioesterase [Acetobacteraceae bacterium]|nr:tol-pal system-associated acyl-CoA thioesterase [Acetobacteraceae bacterium]
MNGHAVSIPADGQHRYTLRVYYEDTDAGGVVYHATYLRFAERARTEALREAGVPHAELLADHGVMFMVRRIEVDYLRPARLDDSLTIVTNPLAVGGASATLRQDVLGPDGPCAILTVRLACVKPGDGRPGRLPQRWRAALTAMCNAAAAARNRE